MDHSFENDLLLENECNLCSNISEYLPERQSSTAARLTRFGLPILTDSIVEIVQPDGKRQYRCPLCLNSYVNRSGLNRHYITHSSQDLWKVGQSIKKIEMKNEQIFYQENIVFDHL